VHDILPRPGAYDPAGFGEPTLAQLLADPLVRQVMQRDGWDLTRLEALLAAAALRLRQGDGGPARPGSAKHASFPEAGDGFPGL
jgi:hypothetical protein